MARYKASILILVFFSLAGLAAGMGVEIELDSLAQASVQDIQYQENFTDTLQVNASVYNSGSVGCAYRLRAEMNSTKDNETIKKQAYSAETPLTPGQTERINLYHTPLNQTGQINTTLYLEYCGYDEEIDEFETESLENTTLDENFTLEETSVNETRTEANIGVEEGLLVPIDVPGYWKAAPAEIKENQAKLDYDAPVFKDFRNITYAVVNESTGQTKGIAETNLKHEETYQQLIRENILYIILGISVFVNLILLVLAFRDKPLKLKF